MSLSIIFEDEELLVINKPWGITVNRSDTTKEEETLQDLADRSGKIAKDTDDDEFESRAGIVHRLDKETSGVMLIARNPVSFHELQRQFKERIVEKSYVALAHGDIIPKSGQISVPVGRLPWNRKRFGVVSGGRESQTFYEVIKEYENSTTREKLSLVRLFPKTGRTHQIRVHLKYINHPIFADPLYSGRKTARQDRKELSRVFLHAEKITFLHPKSGEKITFEAPLPEELSNLLEKLTVIPDN
jgi:23S rRNA pseudouridine1911/1915/1917 synthase